MTLETLSGSEFQLLSDDDSREVLGGLAAASHTTADGRCILDGQAVNDYKTDPDEVQPLEPWGPFNPYGPWYA